MECTNLYCKPVCQKLFLGYTHRLVPVIVHKIFVSRIKHLECEVDYSDSCIAVSKNEWNSTSSLVCLIGMNKENFTFNHLLCTQEHKQLLEYFYMCLKCFCHSDSNHKNCMCLRP